MSSRWSTRIAPWVVLLFLFCLGAGAGCGSGESERQVGGSVHSSTVDQKNERQLSYLEVLTAGAVAHEPLPLIMAIHGLGDSPREFKTLLEDLPVKARLILPQGPDRYYGGYSWFDIQVPFRKEHDASLGQGVMRSAVRLARLLDTLVKTKPTRGKPLVTGFSQGGILCFALAVHFPGSAGMAVPIAGALPTSLHKTEKLRGSYPTLLALHGAADTLVPFEYGRATAKMTAAMGIDTTFKAYPSVEHAISSTMHRDLIAAIESYVAKQ